ncbi:Concanavalin A-like lectin/glucanases superfamily protein [uncultured archaeon]|nr:Concanavalin A-like lectin/glucanases superfamily protein [uncultured archaeon]
MITKNTKFFLTLIIFTSLILFSSANFVYAYSWDSNLNNGLREYWTLNETSGITSTGSLGIQNGNWNVSPIWVPGLIGNQANLSGQRMNTFNSFGNNAFSISFWYQTIGSTTEVLFGNAGSCTGDGVYVVAFCGDDKKLSLNVKNGGNVSVADGRWTENTTICDSLRHHVVYSYDGTNIWKVYIDGSEKNLTLNSGVMGNSAYPLQFSGFDTCNYPGINGSLDEIGIWNRTLNNSEVQRLYNSGNGITYTNNFASNLTGAIQWENESILNVNSSNWWNFMNGFNTTQLVNSFNKLSLSESWLASFISSLINYNYIFNLGFYPSSNPSSFYNASTLPKQTGTPFTYYNITTYDRTQTSTSANITIIALPLAAGKNISIECNLLVDSAATGTGIQLNSTVFGTSSRRQVIEYYTSATAQAICQGTNENLQCLSSSSAGTITTPTRISIYTVQSSNGFFMLDLKSEISGSAVNVRAGSWCRSIAL